ncbi:MAG: glycine dehydrogenase (aminomethyl-transferring), partial [Proteobacteria bacterium]
TQYTPYQPEIAQGRLEALLNFQTMVSDLTGLPIANASLLDEGTSAAEAMTMSRDVCDAEQGATYLIASDCHPQTIEVVRTRAEALGIPTKVLAPAEMKFSKDAFGLLLQYPNTFGSIEDYEKLIASAKKEGLIVTLATDLLALCLIKAPGEMGADIAVGTSQRFGVPLGYGGPHAAFFATKDEFKRRLPGRLIGVSKDDQGAQAYRMALQTREQHIRRDKATSNICTAQALLAIMASMYAVYHGPEGLKVIAERTHALTSILAAGLKKLGYKLQGESFFDTITVLENDNLINQIEAAAEGAEINFRTTVSGQIGISFDEKTQLIDIEKILTLFALGKATPRLEDLAKDAGTGLPKALVRKSAYLQHPIFNAYHSETEMMRYIRKLEGRDLSLTRSMIPLGSCTMKLNAASELYPITWPEVNALHPFVPLEQAAGYLELFHTLENYLAACTGFD